MDLSLNEEQLSIREAARSFVQRNATREGLVKLHKDDKTWDPSWYQHFAQAGWTALIIPEEFGGVELDPTSVVIFMAELGRGAVDSPFLSSSILSASILISAEESMRRTELLEGIGEGDAIVIPATRDAKTSWKGLLGTPTALEPAEDGYLLNATKVYVPFAGQATHFLVPISGAKNHTLAVVAATDPGVSTRKLGGFVHANYEVTFENIVLTEADLLTTPTGLALDDATSIARLATAAFQFGGCEEILDMSVSYSNTREQFGVPIGRFQRVQDHIVRLVNALDAARWTTFEAAWALENDRNGAGRSYLAAATSSDAYVEAANAAHEVHAGIGSDPDFGLTLYTQASRTLYAFLGDPAWQRSRLSDTLGWV